MPLDFRTFKREIEKDGYSVEMTAKGHYWLVTPKGASLWCSLFRTEKIQEVRSTIRTSRKCARR